MTELESSIYAAPESDTDVSTSEGHLAAYVGPNNTEFYMERFSRFESGQSSVSWNWPAFFLTAMWLLYRKMWAAALVYWIGIPVAVGALGLALVAAEIMSPVAADLVTTVLYYGFSLTLVPMYANKLYYDHAQKKVESVKGSYSDSEQQLTELGRIGGTSVVPFFIAILVVVLFIFVFAVGVSGA
ncbi:MAG: DUF2628 domain-containing protein [Pseudomonadota bacterium]